MPKDNTCFAVQPVRDGFAVVERDMVGTHSWGDRKYSAWRIRSVHPLRGVAYAACCALRLSCDNLVDEGGVI